ncbi:hypothetical protein VF21_10003 [Pseudogymnoascus sp. 05NY08]|nr:hypothetical protein VF21_10003 [Pseudogymnoascus sp. 05NY08]
MMTDFEQNNQNEAGVRSVQHSHGARIRSAQACQLCHTRKVKCDLSDTRFPCSNCSVSSSTCRPHQRKRKRYSPSPSSPTCSYTRETTGEPSREDPDLQQQTPSRSTQGQSNATDATRPIPVGQPAIAEEPLEYHPNQERLEEFSPREAMLEDGESYLGRSEYLAPAIPFSEARPNQESPSAALPEVDLQILRLQRVFDLPSRSVRAGLIDNFMTYCFPWMPIVERRWLEVGGQNKPSILLLQAVFVAGSRVSSESMLLKSSEEFYRKAKALFFCGHEKNSIIIIIAVCLLHWWSPASPEELSADSSHFWMAVGVRFAYQIGLHREPPKGKHAMLRRRIWWTLVARDSMISAALGRPRTICLDDATVGPPTVGDFPVPDATARLYVAYVTICQIMGDLTQCRLRNKLSLEQRRAFENALRCWVKDLPEELRLFRSSPDRPLKSYNLAARQLHVHYFVNLVILFGSSGSERGPFPEALLASSFLCGIFEDFLVRDELRYLRANFAFMCLAAALNQLTCYRYASLRPAAVRGVGIIKLALQELAKKWRSADTALNSLNRVSNLVLQQPLVESPSPVLSPGALPFYEDFGPDLCEEWSVLWSQQNPFLNRDTMQNEPLRSDATTNQHHGDQAQSMPWSMSDGEDYLSLANITGELPHGIISPASGDLMNEWPPWGSAGMWLLDDMNTNGGLL